MSIRELLLRTAGTVSRPFSTELIGVFHVRSGERTYRLPSPAEYASIFKCLPVTCDNVSDSAKLNTKGDVPVPKKYFNIEEIGG